MKSLIGGMLLRTYFNLGGHPLNKAIQLRERTLIYLYLDLRVIFALKIAIVKFDEIFGLDCVPKVLKDPEG